MKEFLLFIRTEQRRSNVMTAAKIQPFCEKHNINIGCYDGFKVCPRNLTEKNIALYIKRTISVYFVNQTVLVSIKQ